MATNEDLLVAITRIETTLDNHIATEEPVLIAAKHLSDIHGENPEETRARIYFINQWMKREAKREEARDALRRAIIEKGLVLALVAIATYLFGLMADDLQRLFTHSHNAAPK